MSPERDDQTDEQEEQYEDVPPRSIFAATWFRVVLVVIVLGVVGAVAVPYVLDWMNPPPRSASAPTSPMVPESSTAPPPSPADKPAFDKSGSETASDEKSGADKKKDSTLLPAPGASPGTPGASRPEPKAESKPRTAPSAKTPEPKSAAKASSESKATTPPADVKRKSPTGASESATKPSPPRQAAAKATSPAPVTGGAPYWVQVGAFKEPEAAKRVASKLRDENFKVEESVKRIAAGAASPTAKAPTTSSATSGADQYDVFVTGMSVEELNRRLAGKGLAAETSGNGVVVKPSLPLRDAVALSKDLAVEGFKVQVRRAGGSAAPTVTPPTSAASAPSEGGQALHRVRVGAFADKAAAQAAARELEAKGYKPYIARGDQ